MNFFGGVHHCIVKNDICGIFIMLSDNLSLCHEIRGRYRKLSF